MWQFNPWKLDELKNKQASEPPPPDKFADAKKIMEEENISVSSDKDTKALQDIFNAFNSKNWDISSEAENTADIADKLSKLDDNIFNLCEAIVKQNYIIIRQNNALISQNDALKTQNDYLLKKVDELSDRLENLENPTGN